MEAGPKGRGVLNCMDHITVSQMLCRNLTVIQMCHVLAINRIKKGHQRSDFEFEKVVEFCRNGANVLILICRRNIA